MRLLRPAKKMVAFSVGLLLTQIVSACGTGEPQSNGETASLTIATVNNGDMVVMQELSSQLQSLQSSHTNPGRCL